MAQILHVSEKRNLVRCLCFAQVIQTNLAGWSVHLCKDGRRTRWQKIDIVKLAIKQILVITATDIQDNKWRIIIPHEGTNQYSFLWTDFISKQHYENVVYLWASRSSFGVNCASESRIKICPHLSTAGKYQIKQDFFKSIPVHDYEQLKPQTSPSTFKCLKTNLH